QARGEAVDVLAQAVDVVEEGLQFGARHHVARFLGDVFGGAARQAATERARLRQGGADRIGDLHAEDLAEHAHQRLLPVRVEPLGDRKTTRLNSRPVKTSYAVS